MTQSHETASAIRAELGRQNKSRADLARALGATDMWVSRRLTGQTPLSVDDVADIARTLGVPLSALIGDDTKASA